MQWPSCNFRFLYLADPLHYPLISKRVSAPADACRRPPTAKTLSQLLNLFPVISHDRQLANTSTIIRVLNNRPQHSPGNRECNLKSQVYIVLLRHWRTQNLGP